MRSKVFIVVGIVAVIVAIGVAVGLLAGRGSNNPPPVPPPEVAVHTQAAPVAVEIQRPPPPLPPPHTEIKPVIPVPPVQTSSVSQVPTNTVTATNWDDKIDDIIGSDEPDTNKVKQLFALFPQMPPDDQETAVQHLSNLVEDENYAPLGELLKDPKLPEGVQDELISDALNRPNTLKLPVLLDVARNPDHAKAEEAKEFLELYLGEDYGKDWKKWQDKMTTWLKENPE